MHRPSGVVGGHGFLYGPEYFGVVDLVEQLLFRRALPSCNNNVTIPFDNREQRPSHLTNQLDLMAIIFGLAVVLIVAPIKPFATVYEGAGPGPGPVLNLTHSRAQHVLFFFFSMPEGICRQ